MVQFIPVVKQLRKLVSLLYQLFIVSRHYVSCFMKRELNSAQRKIRFLMVVLFTLKIWLVNLVFPASSWFLKTFVCSPLFFKKFSQLGCPLIFWQQFVLDMAMAVICSTMKKWILGFLDCNWVVCELRLSRNFGP